MIIKCKTCWAYFVSTSNVALHRAREQRCAQTAVMKRVCKKESTLCAQGMQSMPKRHMDVCSQCGCIVQQKLIINRSHSWDFIGFPVLLIQKSNALVFIGWLHEHTFVMATVGQATLKGCVNTRDGNLVAATAGPTVLRVFDSLN